MRRYSQINPYNEKGSLLDPRVVGLTTVHEMFHTLRLDHPFERTQTKDTELLKVGTNSYSSTVWTDKSIVNNIMSYPMIVVDGKTGQDQRYLTEEQFILILDEIRLQNWGFGSFKYNGEQTYEQNKNRYEKYYKNYWDENKWPGEKIQ